MPPKKSRRSSLLPINNDDQEKHQRRQSAIMEKKRQSLLPSQAGKSPLLLEQEDIENSHGNGKLVPSSSVEKLSVEEISKRYDEWMKIAADNKINTNNSWSVQLIDYFHELSLMRDGDSINFQKASCTLDGCVKIYTSRVDAVATETNRLLSGLADDDSGDGTGKSHSKRGANSDGEMEEDGDDDAPVKQKGRRKLREGATIEKNPQSLNVKKFDVEFSVDPLFKKTCADFDEGGASGLLLNHLSIFGNGKIVFDASDVEVNKTSTAVSSTEAEELIDLSDLMSKFGDDLREIKSKTVCPSLTTFKFTDKSTSIIKDLANFGTKASSNAASNYMEIEDQIDNVDIADEEFHLPEVEIEDVDDDESEVEMFHANEHFDMEDYETGGFMSENEMMEDATEHPANHTSVSINPSVTKERKSIASSAPQTQVQFELTNDDLYSYIDIASGKNWAPPHFRVLRPARKVAQSSSAGTDDVKGQKKKKEKLPFVIDFLGMKINQKDLFDKDTKGTTLLSKNKLSNADGNLLPMDIHYSVNDLSQLFLKPKLKMIIRNGKAVTVSTIADGGIEDNNIDDGHYSSDNDDVIDHGAYDDYEEGFAPMTYENTMRTSFGASQESVDDVPFSQADVAASITRVKPEAINYAKKAKRVDIKQLKDKIWSDLVKTSDKNRGEFKFTNLVKNVQSMYPEDKAREITPSFYFICLLHLANENHLTVESSAGLDELTISR